jgi:SWI/SNF-related matrix-associated actin-dependent regulator 1 of chromatin subfamily A
MDFFPFQIAGSDWLAGKHLALLADEMGLGKSAQAIRAADLIGAGRVCVVCPAVARVNWEREFGKFSVLGRDFQVVRSQAEPIDPDRSTIVSYDLLVSNLFGAEGSYAALILDEVHYLKSIDAKRVRAVLGRQGLVRRSDRVWALSATPAPNDVSELWGLLYTFGATNLGYVQFLERYCVTVETNYGPRVVGNKAENMPELRATLAPILLRRKKEEVMTQLPPITYEILTVEPGAVDFEMSNDFCLYTYPVDRRTELMDKIHREEQLMSEILRTQKAASPPVPLEDGMHVLEGLARSVSTLRKYHGLQKIKPALELITAELKAKAYQKIVIFCIHVDVVEQLRMGLQEFGVVTVYGGTAPDKRQKNIDAFQSDHPRAPRVFIGNIHAAGTAITLTAANQVVFVEQDWVPGNNAQAAMRCHRIGQTRPVFVRYLSFGRGTLDGRISDMCARKTRNLLEAGL